VKNLLKPAVNRGDLRSFSYNKTIFGWNSARTPLGELMTLSQILESNEEGGTSSLFSSRLGTQGCFILLLNWYHPLLQLYNAGYAKCSISRNVVSDVFILQVCLFFFFGQLLVFYYTLLSCSCCCACLICNCLTFSEQK